MNSLKPPDLMHLNAAQGWLGLGNPIEANEELEKITARNRAHPDVLNVRWAIYAKAEKWGLAVEIAKVLRDANPQEPQLWINFAYATRRKPDGGLKNAKEILSQAQRLFPAESIIAYNLACYECQLGDLKSAWNWLETAFDTGEPKALKLMALDDPDLEPLWTDISEI
jgi:tetratricopeptide (TPR) repeat protein